MRKRRPPLTPIALAVIGLVLLLPGAASAAPIVFGSPFTNNPSDAPCSGIGTCTVLSYVVPEAGTGNPYSGGAPISGVITKFRVKAYSQDGPGTVTFRVGDVTPNSMNDSEASGSISATGPTVTIPEETNEETPIIEASAQVPVKKGQHLAVNASESVSLVHASSGEKASYVFAPVLADGATPRPSTEVAEELLVQATIEPDADGDETQDQCPTQATTQGPCDNTPPVVGSPKVSGGVLSYVLSEASTVSLQLERKLVGRKVAGRCVAQTKKNKSHARCPLFRKLGAAFGGGGAAGPNRVTLPNGKKLKPGSYRVTITAIDVAGNKTVSTSSFRVKPKKH